MFFIGLTLENQVFRAAILKKERKRVVIETLRSFPYSKDNVKEFYNLPAFHQAQEVSIGSGLTGSEVFIRSLHLPLSEKRKILAALPFQIESLIPFPLEEVVICPFLQPIHKQMTLVTIFCTTQTFLLNHIQTLQQIDIQPDQISCLPAALCRFAAWQFPQEERILCFDVREKRLTFALLETKRLTQSLTLHINPTSPLPSLKSASELADKGKEGASWVIKEKEQISNELDKLFIFLKQKGAIDETTPWMLTGDPSVKEVVRQIFSSPELLIEQPEYSDYALAIGLALDKEAQDGQEIQFCQKKFTPRKIEQNRTKKTLVYAGLCSLAALIMGIGSMFMLHKKEHFLASRLETYLPTSLKTSLKTPEEIEKRLNEWERSLAKHKTPFPLLPTVPKVSDVLAWLSSHPAFANEEGGQKEGIQLKSVHYMLTKYPKAGEASSAYAAQVELEFTADSPRPAREFHDMLLKGDQIVNAKKEVKWHTHQQTYQTSFELNKIGIP